MKSKLFAAVGLLCSALGVWAQSSTFTYQGQLVSNSAPATGLFDLRFALYDAGTSGNQVGPPLTNSLTGVTNGLFAVTLDFGSSVFDGNLRWLEIGVRASGTTNAFTTLAPRQLLTATPYAVRAANYSGPVLSTNITGKINDTNLSANVALLTNNVIFTRSVTASNFIGNGIGLTNISATNLIGTLPEARLSTNVALLNTSNAVFLGGISATNFYGYGGGLTNVPGRIFEVIPTSVNITQAFANFGYLATNDLTAVVVTLPTTANIRIGETIRVSGSGAAGWVVAQNAGQSILVGNLLTTVGVNWTTNDIGRNWKAVASSADGKKLVAVVNGGQVYTSTNYGATWSPRDIANRNWTSVASSADGTKLVGGVNGGQIYTSTDSGLTWTPRFGNANWTSVASSLDGTRLIACASGAGIYISTDSGASWPLNPLGAASWTGVASSGNGANLVATVQGGQIYTSSTNGIAGSWFARESNRSWTCVASSVDGSVLVAGVNGSGFLYSSTDFGASWVPGTIGLNWAGVACSADGARMIAVASGGGIYVSQDSGVSWQFKNNLPSAPIYNGAASSSDGSTMAAVANANGIFVSSKTATTVGVAGSLVGSRLAAVELEHVGGGVFIPISYVGTIRAK